MKRWNENGYKMSEKDGITYVMERGVKYVFVRWDKDDNGNAVPLVKMEWN